jgi:TolB-like protein/class 3 adenylate cyclase
MINSAACGSGSTALATERTERRLAAILAADIAGYSRLMEADEEGTLARVKAHRRELIDPKISEHKGRIVKTTGDGILIEFPSVIEAVACALSVQRGMVERNAGTPEEKRITFRVGVNLGDIIVEDGDIHGDGVNIAARLEGIAEPGGICVSEDAFRHVRGKVDAEFVDIGEQSLKNIARPMRVYRVRPECPLLNPPPQAGEGSARSARVGAAGPTLSLPDKPSIAVLPFANMSGDPEQEYFADGMVEEIITALSRIRWLFVIARNSSFTYKGRAIDVKQVGRELGVRYVLEGSVRKAGGRVRITEQLIDALSGTHLWADRFDGSLEDVFELQDRVAISVAGVIEPTLQAAETYRSANRPTNDLTAYDLYLRALAIYSPLWQQGIVQALPLLEQAIERDPEYGPALSLAACLHLRAYLDGWAEDPEVGRRKGIARARRALEIARDDPVTIAQAVYALGEFGEDIGAMIALIDRCLAFNPSYARGWFLSGALRVDAGEPDIAIEHVETSLRLSPRVRLGAHFSVIGTAHFFLRFYEKAAENLLVAVQEHPSHPFPYRLLASCYAHMGHLDQAREIVKRLRSVTPVVVPSDVPYQNPEHRELFLSGLRLAVGEVT